MLNVWVANVNFQFADDTSFTHRSFIRSVSLDILERQDEIDPIINKFTNHKD